MPDVHSRFLRNTMDDQRATTDSIGTVAIWGLGFAPILTIYYALRGEIFPRAANQRKDKSGGLPFQGTSNTPFVKNNLRGVYTECFQWLKGYNINSSSLGISSRTSNNASIALPSLIVTDHTFGVDAVSSCDNMNTDTEALLPTCVDVPGMLTSATSSSVVVDELGDETKGLPSDVDPANTSRRMRNRSFLRKHSNLTMSTDEGIDMDSEHDIFSSKDSGPDDSPTEPSSSGQKLRCGGYAWHSRQRRLSGCSRRRNYPFSI
uniref:Uncharacterized protein LOC102808994 n=1 Tax=Saccoglossus kowalevskii TaxID=10224 RepID=A0ABM0M9S7_SACKO|nr:PREDICTED: uncharacterized protein LOC102808994 [Saccoglossus kowalevskii]